MMRRIQELLKTIRLEVYSTKELFIGQAAAQVGNVRRRAESAERAQSASGSNSKHMPFANA